MQSNEKNTIFHTLSNGLKILIYPRRSIPQVSTQLWYHVGSRDEVDGQRGSAHFLEHMLFKGTTTLSETDINLITHKLSGYCNAMTSQDYTAYYFDFPRQHWYEALPLLADCMRNATLKQELINSELKAVIQELKMYREDYGDVLLETLGDAIFSHHAYHYPIIGYKQDLWHIERDNLLAFYRKHYIPNNATLIIVGYIDKDEVIEQAQKYFGDLQAQTHYQKKALVQPQQDFVARHIMLYRDIEQEAMLFVWVIPGMQKRMNYFFDLLSWLIGQGKGSRLVKKLIDELQVATDVQIIVESFFDYGLFIIRVECDAQTDQSFIKNIINDELYLLINGGWTAQEMQRAIRKTEIDYRFIFENNQRCALTLGEFFLATGDPYYLEDYLTYNVDLEDMLKQCLKNYFRPILMHTAALKSMNKKEYIYWQKIQEQSDKFDEQLLANRPRILPLESGNKVNQIQICPPLPFKFPTPETTLLTNGLKLAYYNNPEVPMIELILELRMHYYYEPYELQGLSLMLSEMLYEGTKNYPGALFMQALETYGISLNIEPGAITMSVLSADFMQALDFLLELITCAQLLPECIEKIRKQLLAQLDSFWDDPTQFILQLAKEKLYQGHPYEKNMLGTYKSLKAITHANILDWYKNMISPQDAVLMIVGDLSGINWLAIEKKLSVWKGAVVNNIIFPVLNPQVPAQFNYPLNRDQVVLCFAGLSVRRMDPDFDKLLLFDQIFSGGVLGSMNSRLFVLREQTGLFYSIDGSLFAYADEQPGMIFIMTIVSRNQCQEAENLIAATIDSACQKVSQDEFEQARDALINSLMDGFGSNYQIATSLLFQLRYNLPSDYFSNRAFALQTISYTAMLEIAEKFLRNDRLIRIKVGRI